MKPKIPQETQDRIWSAMFGAAVGSWLGLGAVWLMHQIMSFAN